MSLTTPFVEHPCRSSRSGTSQMLPTDTVPLACRIRMRQAFERTYARSLRLPDLESGKLACGLGRRRAKCGQFQAKDACADGGQRLKRPLTWLVSSRKSTGAHTTDRKAVVHWGRSSPLLRMVHFALLPGAGGPPSNGPMDAKCQACMAWRRNVYADELSLVGISI